MDLKARELLKEVTLDYSPTLSKQVNDTVSAIKDAINKIPDDLKVMFSRCSLSKTLGPNSLFGCQKETE